MSNSPFSQHSRYGRKYKSTALDKDSLMKSLKLWKYLNRSNLPYCIFTVKVQLSD